MINTDLNKTDLKILEFCSRTYRPLSCAEIAKAIKLHKTTINQRLEILQKRRYLKRIGKERIFNYRYDFSAEQARKFRLFVDSDEISKLGIDKINKFIEKNKGNENILTCMVYGSVLKTKNFNDMDLLIVYLNRKIEIEDINFDIFQVDMKTFRELYSLGEPRLQAALVNGRILIDRNFIFSYFENDLPIAASQEIMEQLEKKYNHFINIIKHNTKDSMDELKRKFLDALETKAIISFLKNRTAVPTKIAFIDELGKFDKNLAKKTEDTKNAKTTKEFWKIFYANK